MIAIIDYNSGNIASITNALESIGQSYAITSDRKKLQKANRVILPGVGRAGAAMKQLSKYGLDTIIPEIKAPFLGICLGLQLLAEYSDEDDTKCLGIIEGKVRKIGSAQKDLWMKVPHIGWNKVTMERKSPLTIGVKNQFFYFVNSYYFDAPEKYVIGKTCYGGLWPAIIQKNNFYATQFHPEKSGDRGLQVLRNFCERC